MTKAFVMAAALVALTLAMQEAALGETAADDPLADMKSIKLKRVEARPKLPVKQPPQHAASPTHPAQPVQTPVEEVAEVRSNAGIGYLPSASGTFVTTGPAGSPPPPPPAARSPQPSQQSSRGWSSPWSNMWGGFFK